MSTNSPLERAIYKKLSEDSDISSIVATRISPLVLDQELALPAITYDISSSRPYSDLSGGSRLISLDMDFLCMADTFLAASDLGEEVRKALSGFRGSIYINVGGLINVEILGCTHTNDRTDYAAPVDGGRQGSYIRMLSFLISYRANATG
tara:strand:- start:2238 stop:2687 length:450 start_codon:yes stop_codon:yes gene_type:complete